MNNACLETKMTPRQQAAVEQFRRFLEKYQAPRRDDRPAFQKEIVEFRVEETEHLVSITAKIDMPQLSENNLLRFYEGEYWLVFIGPRGSLTAKMYPKSFNQFKTAQRKAFGINFK
jgi:hypothetical protein